MKVLFGLFLGVISRSVFVPTSEWQVVGDEPLPSGLHYRINMTTGLKEAKLLPPFNKWDRKKPVATEIAHREGI